MFGRFKILHKLVKLLLLDDLLNNRLSELDKVDGFELKTGAFECLEGFGIRLQDMDSGQVLSLFILLIANSFFDAPHGIALADDSLIRTESGKNRHFVHLVLF